MNNITSSNKSKFYWNLIKQNLNKFTNKVNNKFIAIIEILQQNKDIMMKCYYEIVCISKKYPPHKNENKFIYGKLIEMSLINAFENIGIKCKNLDDKHKCGSEYKNDLRMFNVDISIKAKLNKYGNVILINKKSTCKHIIKIETILCVINESKMYFIPSNIVNNEIYVKEDAGCISYKSSLFTMMNKKYNNFIYLFPKLNDEYKQNIENIIEVDIYKKLYHDTIKLL